jgi:radical SAM superfamily enzyme YgiQ (UPF0313 family)
MATVDPSAVRVRLVHVPSDFLMDPRAFPPLGILYLGAALREAGAAPGLLDLVDVEGPVEPVIDADRADLYGLSASTPQYPAAARILRRLRRHNPDALFVLGGAHASSDPRECLRDGFDTVVEGEGERAIVRIARALQKGERVTGIVREPYIEDIDTIPFPQRDLLELSHYGYEFGAGKASSIITSRGCPYRCAFCAKDVWQSRVRLRSAANVVAEIRHVIDTYGRRAFLFLDDCFALRRERLYAILDAVAPWDIRFRCYMRPDRVRPETLARLKRAGCVEIGMGVESGSQRILDTVDKGTTVEQNTRAVQLCKEAGIVANAFLMIGLPGETRETVEETRRWMHRAKPRKFGFNIFTAYEGTPIKRHPEVYDICLHPMPHEKSWVKGRRGEYACHVSTAGLSREEILALHQELFREFVALTGHHRAWVGEKP